MTINSYQCSSIPINGYQFVLKWKYWNWSWIIGIHKHLNILKSQHFKKLKSEMSEIDVWVWWGSFEGVACIAELADIHT